MVCDSDKLHEIVANINLIFDIADEVYNGNLPKAVKDRAFSVLKIKTNDKEFSVTYLPDTDEYHFFDTLGRALSIKLHYEFKKHSENNFIWSPTKGVGISISQLIGNTLEGEKSIILIYSHGAAGNGRWNLMDYFSMISKFGDAPLIVFNKAS